MRLIEVTLDSEFPITITKEDFTQWVNDSDRPLYEKLFSCGMRRNSINGKYYIPYTDQITKTPTILMLSKEQYEELCTMCEQFGSKLFEFYQKVVN